MHGSDYFGVIFMVLWGIFALWFFNRAFRSEQSLSSLITKWPFVHPKEFLLWLGMAAVVLGLLCLLLFLPDNSSALARQHRTAPGTFIEYHGDHGNFSYSFVVENVRYHGYGSSDQAGGVDDIKGGLPFVVYYYPADPTLNSVSEPIRDLQLGRVTVIFFTVLFVGVLAILVRKLGSLIRAGGVTSFVDHHT